MKILGINASPWLSVSHDASAALVTDGKLICAIEEERLIRKRRAYDSLPLLSVKYCLEENNLNLDDIDYIVFSWDWENKGPEDNIDYRVDEEEIFNKYFPKKYFEYKKKPQIKYVEHHLAHAASSFRCSGLESAGILVVDGQGEYCSTSIWAGNKNKIKKVWSNSIEESLGYFYTAITKFLGMRNGDEGKLMGLAPYGEVRLDMLKKLENIMTKIKLSDSDMKLKGGQQKKVILLWMNALEQAFGKQDFNQTGYNRLASQFSKKVEFNKYQHDLAASAQKFLEIKILELVDKTKEMTNLSNFCIAGGVALNCISNQRIIESKKINQFYAFAGANDAGTSIGAALEFYASYGVSNIKLEDSYLGPSFSNEEIEMELKNFKISYTKEKNIVKTCANLLNEYKIIGWFQGKMEFGPRALGNRSILANPKNKIMWEKVNKIKEREIWRPFAPSILQEDADDFFELNDGFNFMIVGSSVKTSKINLVPAVVHVDQTSRPQSVSKESNPLYHSLLTNFKEKSGVPLLLNTSLNGKGEPIVCTPRDAIRYFFTSGLDALAIGDFLLLKQVISLSLN